MKHFLFMTLLFPIVLIATAAYAAEDETVPRRWLDHHNHPHGPAVYGTSNRAPAPAVYGWSYRSRAYRDGPAANTDCGVYHYWDGSHCVDARDNPPPM